MDPVIEADRADIDPTVRVGPGSSIRAESLFLGPGVVIGNDVSIDAEVVQIGHRSHISDGCTIRGLGSRARRIDVGDQFFLGPSSLVLVPEFIAGDYVAIHNHLLCNGYEPCVIGHNTWIGQNCILNSTASLTIGNNVGVGAYSSIYTHAYNGELLEGCEIFNKAPVVLEDNAWLVGGYNVISPGVTIGARGVVLTSSVVSRDVPPAHAVGGVPAKDLTDRLVPFRDVSVTDKLDMMRRFVREFVEEFHPHSYSEIPGGHLIAPGGSDPFAVVVLERFDRSSLPDVPMVAYTADPEPPDTDARTTVFSVASKRYTKRRTACEVALIGFMNGYRARFVPSDNPRVGSPEPT